MCTETPEETVARHMVGVCTEACSVAAIAKTAIRYRGRTGDWPGLGIDHRSVGARLLLHEPPVRR